MRVSLMSHGDHGRAIGGGADSIRQIGLYLNRYDSEEEEEKYTINFLVVNLAEASIETLPTFVMLPLEQMANESRLLNDSASLGTDSIET